MALASSHNPQTHRLRRGRRKPPQDFSNRDAAIYCFRKRVSPTTHCTTSCNDILILSTRACNNTSYVCVCANINDVMDAMVGHEHMSVGDHCVVVYEICIIGRTPYCNTVRRLATSKTRGTTQNNYQRIKPYSLLGGGNASSHSSRTCSLAQHQNVYHQDHQDHQEAQRFSSSQPARISLLAVGHTRQTNKQTKRQTSGQTNCVPVGVVRFASNREPMSLKRMG